MQILQSKNSGRLEITCLFLLFLTLLFLAIPKVSAESYDLNLSINASSEFILGQSNTYKLIVKNLNYTSGQDEINFTLQYFITNSSYDNYLSGYPKITNNSLKRQSTISRSWTPDYGGNFTICCNITLSTANDSNPSNDFTCENVTVNATEQNQTQENQSQQNQSQQSNTTSFNLKLKVYIENATSGNVYTSLFKIETNKDNCSIKDNIIINYNISNFQYFYQNSSLKEIGCSGYANTGYWLAQEGNFTICGTASAREESNLSDNSACRIIQVQAGESMPNQSSNETEESENEDNGTKTNYEYIITEVPEIINESNLNFTINIMIKNNVNESKIFDVWSYIYRANKCYSQDREENKKTLSVNAKGEISTELYNYLNVSEIKENGDYKFKVKILRTEIKTPKEFTYNITISLSNINSAIENNANEKEEFLNNQSIKSSETYISEGEKIKNLAPYLFAVVCLMVIIYMMKNKEKIR